MGITNYSGPPAGAEGACDSTCRCDGMGAATQANGAISDTGAPGGIGRAQQEAPLGQGGQTSAGPGQTIGRAGTATTQIKLKSSPGVFSQNSTETECLRIPLKNGDFLKLGWVRLNGSDYGYGDDFWPAGSGAIWTFYPSARNLNNPGSNEGWVERLPDGAVYYGTSGIPHSQIARIGTSGATYFTVYEERLGTYFEYFQGASPTDHESGRLNRQYDVHGNEFKYDNRYVTLASAQHLMPFAIGGNALGRVIPYFEYSGTTGTSSDYHVAKIYLLDLDAPSNSRTIYFNYTGGPSAPVLSSIVYPNGCTHQYNSTGGVTGEGRFNVLNREVDAEGYTTYYDYVPPSGSNFPPLKRTVEPEGRIVYYDYVNAGITQKTHVGRGTTYFNYNIGSGDGQTTMPTVQADPQGNATRWGYDPSLNHITRRVNPNGDLAYFEYVGGSARNLYGVNRKLRAADDAQTYYGYKGGTYDLNKVVGSRHSSTLNATTYYEYTATRDRATTVDALGSTTRIGYDSLGRKTRIQDPRGNVTYFAYGSGTGHLDTVIMADGNVVYFGYNSFREMLREVSPRWKEQNVAAFTTYYEVDQLGRRTKAIDPLNNVMYFSWTSRSDPLDTVDALGAATAHTYNGLRLRTKTTVTDKSEAMLWQTKDGFDPFKNRVQTQDGLGNATYFFYDSLDRPIARKDALQNTTYMTYDSMGKQTIETDARNNSTYYFYDALSRQNAMRDALGNLTYYFYDLADNQSVQLDARRNATYFFYDALNRRQSIRDAQANPAYHFYDAAGNQYVTLNVRFAATYFGYDAVDRQTQVQDALGNTTYFGYDAARNQTRIVDARSNVTLSGFDALNRTSARQDALGNVTYFFYDAVGNQTKAIDARLNTTYFFYDGLRRTSATRDVLGNATYFFYDLAGNQTVSINARFASIYFGYDALNRQAKVQDAVGNTAYFAFDAVGNRTHVIDARLNTTYHFYDALNRTSVTRDGLAQPAYYFYDPVGNQTVILNARFKATYFGYDALSRQSQIQDALGNATYFAYDAVGNRTQITDARSNSMSFGYDLLDRQTVSADGLGLATLFGYDAVGNLTTVGRGAYGYGTQPYGTSQYGGVAGATTYYFYDGLNRNSALRDAVGNTTYFFHDAVSNRTLDRNPLAHATYYGYDQVNRLVRIQDALAATTYFEYDPVGNRTGTVDANGRAIQMKYDKLNRLDSMLAADGGSTYYFYDAVGNRTHDRDPRLNTTYYGYDVLNRPVRIQDDLAQTMYFEYDPVGSPSRYIDTEGASSTLTYDAIDRPTDVAYAVAGAIVSDGLKSTVYYIYDQVGNITQMGDLWGLHRMGFDAANRMTQHQYPNGNVVYYRYDARHNVTARAYPGASGTSGAAYDNIDRQIRIQAPSGATAYFSYDAASNLRERLLGNSAKLVALYDQVERLQNWRYASNNAAALTYFDYSRDVKGLITKTVREATHTIYYSYDASNRLTMELWSAAGSEVYGYRYAYDLAGNRTASRTNGSDTYYFYDQANQLTVKGTNAVFASPTYYLYDRNGSLTDLIEPTGTTKFAYNAGGLVARMKWKDASSTYFFYDGSFRRYALNQNGTINYFVWDGLDLLQELNADGSVKEEYTQSKSPTSGIGQLVEVYRPSDLQEKLYPVMDPRGTITKYIQSDGTTVFASREYDAFGNLIPNSSGGTWPGLFCYQGQAWQEIKSADGAQRLMLSPTRLYDSTDGHFLSRDPLRLTDPTIAPNLIQPFYHYVMQQPLSLADADGKSSAMILGQQVNGVRWNSLIGTYEVYDPTMGWYPNQYAGMVTLQNRTLTGGGPNGGHWLPGGALDPFYVPPQTPYSSHFSMGQGSLADTTSVGRIGLAFNQPRGLPIMDCPPQTPQASSYCRCKSISVTDKGKNEDGKPLGPLGTPGGGRYAFNAEIRAEDGDNIQNCTLRQKISRVTILYKPDAKTFLYAMIKDEASNKNGFESYQITDWAQTLKRYNNLKTGTGVTYMLDISNKATESPKHVMQKVFRPGWWHGSWVEWYDHPDFVLRNPEEMATVGRIDMHLRFRLECEGYNGLLSGEFERSMLFRNNGPDKDWSAEDYGGTQLPITWKK